MSPWRSCSRLTYYHRTQSLPYFGSHHIARRTHFRWMQSWISIGGLEDCSHESQWEILKIATMNFSEWLEDVLEFSNGDYNFEFRWKEGEFENGRHEYCNIEDRNTFNWFKVLIMNHFLLLLLHFDGRIEKWQQLVEITLVVATYGNNMWIKIKWKRC